MVTTEKKGKGKTRQAGVALGFRALGTAEGNPFSSAVGCDEEEEGRLKQQKMKGPKWEATSRPYLGDTGLWR